MSDDERDCDEQEEAKDYVRDVRSFVSVEPAVSDIQNVEPKWSLTRAWTILGQYYASLEYGNC